MSAVFANVAARRSGSCTSGAGHMRAASPVRTVRTVAASKPKVVTLAAPTRFRLCP